MSRPAGFGKEPITDIQRAWCVIVHAFSDEVPLRGLLFRILDFASYVFWPERHVVYDLQLDYSITSHSMLS